MKINKNAWWARVAEFKVPPHIWWASTVVHTIFAVLAFCFKGYFLDIFVALNLILCCWWSFSNVMQCLLTKVIFCIFCDEDSGEKAMKKCLAIDKEKGGKGTSTLESLTNIQKPSFGHNIWMCCVNAEEISIFWTCIILGWYWSAVFLALNQVVFMTTKILIQRMIMIVDLKFRVFIDKNQPQKITIV